METGDTEMTERFKIARTLADIRADQAEMRANGYDRHLADMLDETCAELEAQLAEMPMESETETVLQDDGVKITTKWEPSAHEGLFLVYKDDRPEPMQFWFADNVGRMLERRAAA